ncbi:MAG: carboxypeptidase regulatory-like domain-containing protein [Acidobacteria bacterium]|nr:carboxypeptidase regulatory-like domain-containing protein [Acidobacteriota bacterium]
MVVLLVVLMAGMFAPFACAQVSTGEISGAVTDQSGAVVAGAKVTADNKDTGASRQTVTSADGSFVMTLLPPGEYSVSVEAQGFRRLVQQTVPLQVSQRLRLDVVLEVGQTTETLQVCEPETSLTSVPVGG